MKHYTTPVVQPVKLCIKLTTGYTSRILSGQFPDTSEHSEPKVFHNRCSWNGFTSGNKRVCSCWGGASLWAKCRVAVNCLLLSGSSFSSSCGATCPGQSNPSILIPTECHQHLLILCYFYHSALIWAVTIQFLPEILMISSFQPNVTSPRFHLPLSFVVDMGGPCSWVFLLRP